MCRVQDALSNHEESEEASKDPSIDPAASAHKSKRLSFAWLDGEIQNVSIMARTLFESVMFPESIRMSLDLTSRS